MTPSRISIILVLVLAGGIIVCPHRPPNVNPNQLLQQVLRAEKTVSYNATRDYDVSYYGRDLHYSTTSAGPDASASALPASIANSLITSNYMPVVNGESVIAGRPVWSVQLKPNRKHFPWRTMWVDKKTHVVLAWRDWSSLNKLKATMTTRSVRYGALCQPKSTDVIAFNRIREAQLANVPHQLGWDVPMPRYAPTCFEYVGIRTDRRNNSAQLIFSDGLYAFNVFLSRSESRPDRLAQNQVHDWGQGLILSKKTKGLRITIVGDMPAEEIEKIASSIR